MAVDRAVNETPTIRQIQLPRMNELEQAEYEFHQAERALLKDPTNQERMTEFLAANKKVCETRDVYRVALKLKLQSAVKKLI